MNGDQIKVPSCVYGGRGSVERLKDILEKERAGKVLLFTDQGVRSAGLCEGVFQVLDEQRVSYEVLDDLTAEPSVSDVDRVLRAAADFQGDLILAVGGGSVMDAAKLASVIIGAEYSVYDLLKKPGLARKQIRSVMMPTTCGTGSEATCNAIVAIPEEDTKTGIVSDSMIPDYAILDAELIARLPKAIVAATGVDALAHAVECFTSKKATPFSDTYALASARLIFRNIQAAYDDPDDMEAKSAMLLGAFYGGAAITGSGTTAVHALSYPLGGKYHMAHGISNAILFAHVMAFNMEACEARLAALCDGVYPKLSLLSEREKARKLVERIAEIVEAVEIPRDLTAFGVKKEDLDFLVEAGSQQKRLLVNNCKELSLEDIRAIYRKVM